MPDEARPTAAPNAGLDDLERRLASFENATRRLGRTVSDIADPVTTGHSSPPRPATRRLSESGAPRGEEISGLRPAVASQGPQTGALTARSRSGNGPTPGFTSAYGKPAIALVPAATPVATDRHATGKVQPTQRLRYIAIGAGAALVVALLLIPRAFTNLGNAAVWAEEVRITTSASGPVDSVPVSVGSQISAGQVLALIAGAEVKASQTGTLLRLFVSPGMRIAAGEPIALLALPGSARIVAALPEGVDAAIGHRVRITLLGEGRSIDGAVEQVLAAGAPGPSIGGGQPPARLVIQADPSPQQLLLGQGAKVTLLGAPTAGRQLLFAIRQVLPW